MPIRTIQHQVSAGESGRVDALVSRLTGLSRARARGLIDFGGVAINGKKCESAATPIGADDVLAIKFDPEHGYRERPAERATHGFSVVFVDDHVVVVNKDAGLLTVPTPRGESNTLVDRLSRHLAKGRSSRHRVSIVHRLDRDTSGLLVFGRTPTVAKNLIAQFAAHKPEREYVAIVAGRVEEDRGTIRSRLVTDKALNQKSVRTRDENRGELAVTHFEVTKRFGDATLVAVRLETGQRNQIRVHFAEMGHPVLGDTRYEAERAELGAWPHDRLALHARVLGFRHPVEGREVRFEAPLPREFASFKGS